MFQVCLKKKKNRNKSLLGVTCSSNGKASEARMKLATSAEKDPVPTRQIPESPCAAHVSVLRTENL